MLATVLEGDSIGPATFMVAGGIGGMGSGIGVGISAMMIRRRVIYVRPGTSSAKLTVSPLVTGERKGVLMSLGF